MTVKLLNPFLEATRSVFQMMLDLSDITDHPADGFKCDEELDISIGITGDLTGEVIYRFPRATSLRFVTILSGMEVETVDDFVASAVSEIANIISGNVATLLSDAALHCDILPPEPAKTDDGKDYELRAARCLKTPAGDVCLDIRLNPAQ